MKNEKIAVQIIIIAIRDTVNRPREPDIAVRKNQTSAQLKIYSKE
jgi:hypothetical protein